MVNYYNQTFLLTSYRKTYNHKTGEWEHTDIFYTDVTVNFVEQ